MAEDSKSDQECQATELSSGENILDHTNTCSELETTGQEKASNGSSSIEELEPSELLREDHTFLLTDSEEATKLVKLLLSDHGEVRSTKRVHSMEENTETLETMLRNVSMFTELEMLTTCTLSSGTATMVLTKPGTLTLKELDIQNNHITIILDSKSDQDFQREETWS